VIESKQGPVATMRKLLEEIVYENCRNCGNVFPQCWEDQTCGPTYEARMFLRELEDFT